MNGFWGVDFGRMKTEQKWGWLRDLRRWSGERTRWLGWRRKSGCGRQRQRKKCSFYFLKISLQGYLCRAIKWLEKFSWQISIPILNLLPIFRFSRLNSWHAEIFLLLRYHSSPTNSMWPSYHLLEEQGAWKMGINVGFQWKKPISKHDSMYMTFSKWHNYGDRGWTSGC